MPHKYPWPSRSTSRETLHVYRALLREISYLPPAFAGAISSHVRLRFHADRYPSQHDKTRVSKAKRALRNIKLANNGDGERMLKLMHRGFGRTGLKRWQLFGKLTRSEGPQDSEALKASTAGETPTQSQSEQKEPEEGLSAKEKQRQARENKVWPGQKGPTQSEKEAKSARKADIKAKAAPDPNNADLNHKWLDEWDRKKLRAFLESQKEQQHYVSNSGPNWDVSIRNTSETRDVPEETSWGKPPTKQLVRTKVAKFWQSQQTKILPPLPKGEWDLLKKLAQGAQEDEAQWKLPSRRIPARPKDGSSNDGHVAEEWDWEAYATKKTRASEPGTFVKPSKRLGWVASPFTGETPRDALSPRWFRRQYQQILLKSAYTEKNPNTLQSKFIWGKQRAYNVKPAPHQSFLFEKPSP